MLITGAGSGFGRAMAHTFSAQGYSVAVTDIDLQRAESVVAELRERGAQGFAQRLDTRTDSDWDSLFQRVLTEWGRLDVLINNAGVSSAGRMEQSSLPDWQWMMDINFMGVVKGCHRFLPMMRENRSGHVVNVASIAGLIQVPALASYCAAKSAVVALSEQMRVDLAGTGVGVSVLCPSFVKTGLLESMRSPDSRSHDMARKWMDKTNVTADDVAESVLKAVQKNRFMILIHYHSRWAWRLKRWFPGLFHRVMVFIAGRLERGQSS